MESNGLPVIDLTGWTDDDLASAAVMAKAFKERMDVIEKAAKATLEERMGEGTARTVTVAGRRVAVLKRTRAGSYGRYRVTDRAAYGAWLAAHGRADDTETEPVARDAACTDEYVKDVLAAEDTGEIPDGVKYAPPRSSTITAALDEELMPLLSERGLSAPVRRLIEGGMEDTAMPADTSARTPAGTSGDVFSDMGL
ncbi:hypothetical protein [Bifidobacterium castoris]|uniref:Uncharacterized protein n=1 Tax=Bifidobacterium castoris TaxID=2306972 RepID=A0A430FA82_9BIFI|nr:hypothetical protein [Bifidobacterium castoris]RSX49744.1 hypothetical protein D2E22_0205 [Bifidobacterium castoris]